jgi:hypothetical protein
MRMLTDEIGTESIHICTPAELETSDAVDTTLDGRRHNTSVNYRPNAPLPRAGLVATVDNGPDFIAANDNNTTARLAVEEEPSDQIKEMYERGELGIGEPENRRHWIDSQRFKQMIDNARGEPDNSNDNWRELHLEFFEGFFGHTLTSLTADEGLVLGEDMEFDDTDTPADFEAIDGAGWNPFRDSEPHVRELYGKQVASLMSEVLGADYDVLEAFIVRRWTAKEIGETQGYKNRATASACGKGMIRSALRNLSRFVASLDRLEARGQRPQDVWPLVGTLNWPIIYTPGYYRPRDNMFTNKTPGPVRRYRGDVRMAA